MVGKFIVQAGLVLIGSALVLNVPARAETSAPGTNAEQNASQTVGSGNSSAATSFPDETQTAQNNSPPSSSSAPSPNLAPATSATTTTITRATSNSPADQSTNVPNNSLEQIVVTATKRASLIQDVPFSVNAQTAADIEQAHATSLEDLSRNVAGLTIQNLGPGQSQVAIRGISSGQIVRDQPGVKEQVGIYLDESVISLSLFTPDLDFYDMNRVETLRGPQGTLFGSGSEGGTLRYISNQPNFDKLTTKFETEFNGVDGGGIGGSVRGAVNIPINDWIAARIVAYHTNYPGFISALQPGGSIAHDVNDGYRDGGRIAFTVKPADWITITPRIVIQKLDNGGFNREDKFNILANPYTTTVPPVTLADREQYLALPERFQDQFFLFDNNINVDLGPVALTSITTYSTRDILVSRDATSLTGSVSSDLGFPQSSIGIPSNLQDRTKLDQVTQEARLQSNYESPLQWTVGVFYSNVNRNYTQRLPTPGYDAIVDAGLGAGTSASAAHGFGADSPYNSNEPYTLRQIAVFAEGTYDLTKDWHFTAGARYYDYKESRLFYTGGLFSNDDNGTGGTSSNGATPRFIASYNATDQITVDAQASQGFRLGGVNDALNLPLCKGSDVATYGGHPNFQDETLWNYELDAKANFGKIQANLAYFYNDISNLQITADAGSCSSRVIFNVPTAHSQGVELELTANPLPGLELGLYGTAIDSVFDSTVRSAAGAIIGGIQTGNRLPTTPEMQLSADATYTYPIDPGNNTDLIFDLRDQYIGSRYTQALDEIGNPQAFVSGVPYLGASGKNTTFVDLQLPAYNIVNFSTSLRFENDLNVSFYIKNLTDELALLAFDRERGGRARLAFDVNPPRTFGVTMSKSF